VIAVVDGALVPARDARISALDRAAWYGDCAFETFRTYGRRVLALDARLARLSRSLARLGIAAEEPVRELRADLARAIEAFESEDAYVRLAVSRGPGYGGLLPRGDEVPTRLVFVGALPSFPPRYGEEGLSVVTQAGSLVPGGARAAGAKLASYVEPMLAAVEARALGADDGIGLDRDGVVLEAATSNVIVYLDGAWATPPTSLGILPGVTRSLVARVAAQAQGRAAGLRERLLTVHDLYRADEIALTSSVRGLCAVTRIDDRPVSSGKIGVRFRELETGYRALIEAEACGVDAPPDSR